MTSSTNSSIQGGYPPTGVRDAGRQQRGTRTEVVELIEFDYNPSLQASLEPLAGTELETDSSRRCAMRVALTASEKLVEHGNAPSSLLNSRAPRPDSVDRFVPRMRARFEQVGTGAGLP